ncbi:MAG: histidinol-phosphate transaminase [Candidatus Electryoneaceae bacterium]|nr:histidinol-phosphate transaminase [Candidatus Electryoneaceae bacterium]
MEETTGIIKLSQNENAFGASPLALEAIEKNYLDVFRYPDVLHNELKQKLAEKFNVTPEHIVISAGSIALMDMSIKSFVGFDQNIVTADITFEGYKLMAKINGRECRLATLEDSAISLGNILSLCDDKTKLIFIANPNNPTGTMITHREMVEFMQKTSLDVYVVCDEAYAEYITDPEYPDTLELMKTYPNLIIFRTFSKIYGLAGIRIGYAIGHPNTIKSLRESWTPFSINNLALNAALAALDDQEHVDKCASINAEERIYLYDELRRMGFAAIEPTGNFIYLELGDVELKGRLYDHLVSNNIFVRPLDRFGIATALRITVGKPHENRRLIDCLLSFRT